MKAIVQISISHSNSIDLNNFLEKIKIAAEELTEDYMQGADRYKNRTIDIEIESFTRIPINLRFAVLSAIRGKDERGTL